MAFLPLAAGSGLHPWVVAMVVLAAANLWIFPYQFTSYAAFFGASDGRLFSHAQVRGFSVAYTALTLLGLLAALPLWRALGLVG